MSEIVIRIKEKSDGSNIYTVQVAGKTVGDFTRYNQTEEDLHEILDEVLKANN